MQELRGGDKASAVDPEPPAVSLPRQGVPPSWRAILGELTSWPLCRWLIAGAGAAVGAVLMGAPTDLLPNGLFERMTPAEWWNYPVWFLSSLLFGVVVATYAGRNAASNRTADGAPALGGGIVSVLAVGCPVCNKLVVLALGSSGALTYFAPAQPVLAVLALGLLALGLRSRLRTLTSCPAPLRRAPEQCFPEALP